MENLKATNFNNQLIAVAFFRCFKLKKKKKTLYMRRPHLEKVHKCDSGSGQSESECYLNH